MSLPSFVQRSGAVVLLAASVLAGPVAGTAASGAATTLAEAQAGTFVPVIATRIMDTRRHLGASAPAAHATVQLSITGHAGVPTSGVVAVVLTLTVTGPTAGGYLTTYADRTKRPATSNLNFRARQTIAGQVYAPVGRDGSVALYNASSGSTQLIGDVAGYFAAAPSRPGGAFVSTPPARVLDTRTSLGARTPNGRGTVRLAVLDAGPVPASGVSAVAIDVTTVSAAAAGYVSAYADGTARPSTSNLNFEKGDTVANLAIVPVGTDGKIALYNGSAGPTPLAGDVVGYFLGGQVGAPGTYAPVTPSRVADGVAQPRGNVDVVWARAHLPANAAAEMVVNAAVVRPAASGYLAVSDDENANAGRASGVSNVNFAAGQTVADLAAVPYGHGLGALYNASAGKTRAIADVFGYYVAAPGFGTGAIAGTVRDADGGAGVAGVRVNVYLGIDNDDGTEAGSTTTGADGTYRVAALPVNTQYIVCFDTRGVTAAGDPYSGYPSQCYQNRSWDDSGIILPADATLVSTTTGGTVAGVDATVQKRATGTVAGTVTATNGAGVSGVVVNVARTSVTTAANGSYTVAGLTAGTWGLCFGTDGVTDANAPYGYVAPPCRDVTVTAGATTSVNETISAAGAVSGRFTTSTRAAIKFGSVAVVGDAGTSVAGGRMRADGSYTITVVPAGIYRVCSNSDPHLNPPYGLVNACVDNVHVASGEMTSGVSAVMVAAGAISGRVTTQSGTALPNVGVDVIDGSGTVADTGWTDSDGMFSVPGIPQNAAGYAVCFDGTHAGDPPTVPFSTTCYRDQQWTGPSAGPVTVPADVTRVTVRSGAASGGIDQALTSS